jgi:hypothetical protein
MRRDQVIDPRWELNLKEVAAAGKHDETSVRQRESGSAFVAAGVTRSLDHQHGHRKTSSEQWHFGLGDKARGLASRQSHSLRA